MRWRRRLTHPERRLWDLERHAFLFRTASRLVEVGRLQSRAAMMRQVAKGGLREEIAAGRPELGFYVSEVEGALPLYDVTARKVHQWAMVALVAVGFVVWEPLSVALLVLAGLVMLLGRFWWPADVFRQFTWRVLEPARVLRRREVHEDHETRRVARVLGGTVWLLAAGLLLVHLTFLAWVLALAIAAMVALDAAFDFCALCFLLARLRR